MKRISHQYFLYSLTSLAIIASHASYAEEIATAPTLEGGITASIGTFYATPSADHQDFGVKSGPDTEGIHILENNPDYDWGVLATLGYVFDDTANGVELAYRGIHSTSDDNASGVDEIHWPRTATFYDAVSSTLDYELSAVDLMISQFLDIGTHTQVRFAVGASYLNLEKEQHNHFFDANSTGTNDSEEINIEYSGWGPRVAIDGRYDFGENLAGFGIVAGGSLGYFLGEMEITDNLISSGSPAQIKDDIDNHAVTNLRANVGIDYVYFFDNDESTLGIELGYLVDYYADAFQNLEFHETGIPAAPTNSDAYSLTFSGPYVNLKGVF